MTGSVVGVFTSALPQTCDNMLPYDASMAMPSLDDRNFPGPS